jgi:hypothetical protein
MIPFIENNLPPQNVFVMVYYKSQEKTLHRIGYWGGSRWCYITSPPFVQSYYLDDVVGWETLP